MTHTVSILYVYIHVHVTAKKTPYMYVYACIISEPEEHIEISRDFKEKVVEPILKVYRKYMYMYIQSQSSLMNDCLMYK